MEVGVTRVMMMMVVVVVVVVVVVAAAMQEVRSQLQAISWGRGASDDPADKQT